MWKAGDDDNEPGKPSSSNLNISKSNKFSSKETIGPQQTQSHIAEIYPTVSSSVEIPTIKEVDEPPVSEELKTREETLRKEGKDSMVEIHSATSTLAEPSKVEIRPQHSSLKNSPRQGRGSVAEFHPTFSGVTKFPLVRGYVESCPGCKLDKHQGVKKFIRKDLSKYQGLTFKKSKGTGPDLVILGIGNRIVERVSLEYRTRKECNTLLKRKGFTRVGAPSSASLISVSPSESEKSMKSGKSKKSKKPKKSKSKSKSKEGLSSSSDISLSQLTGYVESCPGCKLDNLKGVKKFIYKDLPKYPGLTFKKSKGIGPVLVLLDYQKKTTERIPLETRSRRQCNKLLKRRGFKKLGSSQSSSSVSLRSSTSTDLSSQSNISKTTLSDNSSKTQLKQLY